MAASRWTVPPKLAVTPDEVDKYGQMCCEIRLLEKKKDVLRNKILSAYVQDYPIPQGRIYLLKITKAIRQTIDWKGLAVQLAKQLFGEGWEAWVKKHEESASSVESLRILPQERVK